MVYNFWPLHFFLKDSIIDLEQSPKYTSDFHSTGNLIVERKI